MSIVYDRSKHEHNPFIVRFSKEADEIKMDFWELTPSGFKSLFQEGYLEHYLKVYIEYRARGYPIYKAIKNVFNITINSDRHMYDSIINIIEESPKYINAYINRVNELDESELWSTKLSIHQLLDIANDQFAKEAARLNAIKELNIIYGITIVDDKGKTRKASLDDFYADLEKGAYPQ